MKTYHDYESLGTLRTLENVLPPLLEAFSGQAIVSWYGTIENQLQQKLDDQEAARNFENADRIRAFLNTWRDNEITGSINIDELEPLKAAAEQQSSAKWPLRNYFSSLLNQLRRLIASEEELPRGIDTNQLDPMAGGLGRGAPPMSPDFGPEEDAPGALDAESEEGLAGDLGSEAEEDLGADKAIDKELARKV
jgi:hypothetical protein